MLFVFVLLTSFLTLLSAPARAQYGASLQGTVQDKSGAIVANASVTATDNGTGIVHAATTNSSGFYRISELPPGTYTVTVEKSGFNKEREPRCRGSSRVAARIGCNPRNRSSARDGQRD
jgi:hypothetical protein